MSSGRSASQTGCMVGGAAGQAQRGAPRPAGWSAACGCLSTLSPLERKMERKTRKTLSSHGPGLGSLFPPRLLRAQTSRPAHVKRWLSARPPGRPALRALGSRAGPAPPPLPQLATGTGLGCSSGTRAMEGGGALTFSALSPAGSKFHPVLGRAEPPGLGQARSAASLLESAGQSHLARSQHCPFPSPCREHPHLTSTYPPSGLRETQTISCSAPSGPPGSSQSQSPAQRSPRPGASSCGSPGLTEEMPQNQVSSLQEAPPKPPSTAPPQASPDHRPPDNLWTTASSIPCF